MIHKNLIIILWVLLLVCNTSCLFSSDKKQYSIPRENIAVLPMSAQELRDKSITEYKITDGEINEIRRSIKDYLISKENDETVRRSDVIEKIIDQLPNYKFQFVGYQKNEQIIIHINAITLTKDLESTNNWKQHYWQVNDGYYNYWDIDYDVVNRLFINLYINGVG